VSYNSEYDIDERLYTGLDSANKLKAKAITHLKIKIVSNFRTGWYSKALKTDVQSKQIENKRTLKNNQHECIKIAH
jgi:hypothetical protein